MNVKQGKSINWLVLMIPISITISIESTRRHLYIAYLLMGLSLKTTNSRSSPVLLSYPKESMGLPYRRTLFTVTRFPDRLLKLASWIMLCAFCLASLSLLAWRPEVDLKKWNSSTYQTCSVRNRPFRTTCIAVPIPRIKNVAGMAECQCCQFAIFAERRSYTYP